MDDLVADLHSIAAKLNLGTWEGQAIDEAATELERLGALVGELSGALKPFANEAGVFDGTNFGDHEAAYNGTDITVGDLRRARATRAKLEGES